MNVTLAALALAGVLVLAASTTMAAGGDGSGGASTKSESSSDQGASTQTPAPPPAVPARAGGPDQNDGQANGAQSAREGTLDPGSKCAEFPQMCTAQ
jgi:hypothetical protein